MKPLAPGQFNIKRREVVNSILIQFSGSIVSQGMVAGVMLLTARQLGPTAYGQYVGTMTLVTFASIFFNLGLDLWLLREGGRNPGSTGDLAGSILAIKGSIGLLWLLVMLILARFVDSQALPAQFIRWNAVIILLDSLFLTTLTAFKAILRNTVNAVIEALSDALWLVATILLVLWGVERVLPFLQTRFVIIALSVAVSFLVLRSLLKATASTATIRSALRQCLPYAASDMLTRLYMRADVLIVSLILGGYYVGIYSPAVSITNALFIIPATVHRVMIPLMSNLFAHNIPQARITARNNLVLMTAIGMVLSFGLYLSVWLLPFILGSDFAASQEVLRILSPIPLVHSLSFGVAGILVAANQQKNRSIIQGISALLNILLNLAVIHWGGIIAVAYVYLFSEIVLMLGYVFLLVRLDRHSKLFLD